MRRLVLFAVLLVLAALPCAAQTVSVDTYGNTTCGNVTTCAGPSLSLGGSSDYIVQWAASENTFSSISGAAYTNPYDVDSSNVYGAFAGALNQSSGAAQTWTLSADMDGSASAFALKTTGTSWTLYQHPNNFTCSQASGTGNLACSVTLTHATVAGHSLLLLWSFYYGSTADQPSFASASGDSTWTHCPSGASGHYQTGGTDLEGTDCAYILSASGGATTVTVTITPGADGKDLTVDAEVIEVYSSGSAATSPHSLPVMGCCG